VAAIFHHDGLVLVALHVGQRARQQGGLLFGGYKQTSAKLFGVCLRVLNDRNEAEEALQEVYVKIWTKADRFAVSDLSPISWLVAVARNHSIDRIRQRRRPPPTSMRRSISPIRRQAPKRRRSPAVSATGSKVAWVNLKRTAQAQCAPPI
jgi:RNA polymerase sigma factor (sigma-70 family)